MLDIEVEPVDREPHAAVVEGPGLPRGDPGRRPRAEQAPQQVREARTVGRARELVLRGGAAEREQEFFGRRRGLAAGVQVALDVGALVQGVVGRVAGAVVAGARVDGAAALVAEVDAGKAVGLGGEQVDEG